MVCVFLLDGIEVLGVSGCDHGWLEGWRRGEERRGGDGNMAKKKKKKASHYSDLLLVYMRNESRWSR